MKLKDIKLVFGNDTKTVALNDNNVEDSEIMTVTLQKIEGKENLIQQIIKLLLTFKGSNQYAQSYGSNLYSLMGIGNKNQIDSIKNTIPLILDSITKIIRDQQTNNKINNINLSMDETLVSIELINAVYDDVYGGWILNLNIKTAESDNLITFP